MTLAAHVLGVVRDGRKLLTEVTLDLRAGEMLGIIGPNGAGKSTLVRTLAGFERPTSGGVTSDGKSLRALRGRERATKVAFVAQETGVSADVTVLDLVLMGRYARLRRFARISREDSSHARAALARMGIDGLADQAVPSLSGGERQLVQLARAVAQGAGALLLDEPTSALDIHHQLRVFSLLHEEARAGAAVAVVLHDLNDAARHCDRLAVLHGGRLVALGAPSDVLTTHLLAEVYRVDADVHSDSRGVPHVLPLASIPQ